MRIGARFKYHNALYFRSGVVKYVLKRNNAIILLWPTFSVTILRLQNRYYIFYNVYIYEHCSRVYYIVPKICITHI